ncbi:MAG TPA: hypothetical protein VMX55_01495 [candidate division Zixibacteria bacterium]|nr:hypothetical protein [candidate division Zixibacteria bacterium]
MIEEEAIDRVTTFLKIRKILFIITIIFCIIVVPFLILSVLDIGGSSIFITFIILLSILCSIILSLIIIDIIRIYSKKKSIS